MSEPSATKCKPQSQQSQRFRPVIDRNRCEAKAACVAVCPYAVFEIAPLGTDERAALSVLGRIKSFLHGGKQAFTPRADDCHACGLCVPACPEGAIRLEPIPAPGVIS